MSDRQRLIDLKNNLDLLYEKLGLFEKELLLNPSATIQFELKQRIKGDVLPSIRRYESEYWELYPMEAILISDDEASNQIIKVEEAVSSIERIPYTEDIPELINLLQDIRAKLSEHKTASSKFKIVLPLLPAIASYELEINAEGLMSKVWKPLRKLLPR